MENYFRVYLGYMATGELKPPENPTKKIGQHTTPEGVEEFYDQEGILGVRVFPDGVAESYDKNGKVINRTDREGKDIPIDTPEPDMEGKKADPELATTEEEIVNSSNKDKPGFLRRNALRIGLAIGLGLGVGGGVKKAIDHVDQKEKDAPAKKVEKKDTKKETNPTYVSPAIDLSAEATRLKKETEEKKRTEEITAKVRAELEAKYSAPAVPQKPVQKTRAESIAEIRKLMVEGTALPDEIAEVRRYDRKEQEKLKKQSPAPEVAQTAIERTIQISKPPEPLARQNVYYGGTPRTGSGNYYGGTPIPTEFSYGISRRNFAPEKHPELNNPFHLSKEMLEKVNDVYEENLVKIFPIDTLRIWRKVQNKSAYELVNTAENKVPKAHKILFSYLEKLKTTTGLEPRSGVRGQIESIEKYIERALQKAAKEGKLKEVELK